MSPIVTTGTVRDGITSLIGNIRPYANLNSDGAGSGVTVHSVPSPSILLLLALGGSPHGSQDDSACLPMVAGEHDASQHALGPVGQIQHEHCAICHWLRG